jgi:hypothetical protein
MCECADYYRIISQSGKVVSRNDAKFREDAKGLCTIAPLHQKMTELKRRSFPCCSIIIDSNSPLLGSQKGLTVAFKESGEII